MRLQSCRRRCSLLLGTTGSTIVPTSFRYAGITPRCRLPSVVWSSPARAYARCRRPSLTHLSYLIFTFVFLSQNPFIAEFGDVQLDGRFTQAVCSDVDVLLGLMSDDV